MKQYRWKNDKEIKAHEILYAVTSQDDYEMYRLILLEIDYFNYVVLEGSHCSCYNFDECTWDATEFDGLDSLSELKKFLSLDDYCGLREKAYNFINWKEKGVY